jgi:hypothetical protein
MSKMEAKAVGLAFLPQHTTQAKQVFEEFQCWIKSTSSSSMKIDHDETSVKQSNTTDYVAKLVAMLCDDEETDKKFPPLIDNFRMNTGMVDMAPLIIWLL